MAYTLKSAWASRATVCVAVDDDNTTIKDFVTANTMTAHADVIAGVGTATWKGSTRGYFPTLANGSFNFKGITWSGTKPSVNWNPNWSAIMLLNSFTSSTGMIWMDNGAGSGMVTSSSKPRIQMSGAATVTGTTALATSTKQAVMGIFRRAGTCEIHYGLESGSMSQEATATDGQVPGSDFDITSLGGAAGQANFVGNFHLLLITNDVMSTTDRDNIFSDYVGTLFDTSSTTSIPAIMNHRRNQGMS